MQDNSRAEKIQGWTWTVGGADLRLASVTQGNSSFNMWIGAGSNKIAKIHHGLGDLRASVVPTAYVDDISSAELWELNEITEDDVKAFACKPVSKSCKLEPVQTFSGSI